MSQFPYTTKSSMGNFTFAHIDCPDDVWRWAIVKDYQGDQEYRMGYGDIVAAFAEDMAPDEDTVKAMLEGLEKSLLHKRIAASIALNNPNKIH